MVVGFSGVMIFLFVPETVWDRTPVPKKKKREKRTRRSKSPFASIASLRHRSLRPPSEKNHNSQIEHPADASAEKLDLANAVSDAEHPPTIAERRKQKQQHRVGFMENVEMVQEEADSDAKSSTVIGSDSQTDPAKSDNPEVEKDEKSDAPEVEKDGKSDDPEIEKDKNSDIPEAEKGEINHDIQLPEIQISSPAIPTGSETPHHNPPFNPTSPVPDTLTVARSASPSSSIPPPLNTTQRYTNNHRTQPPRTFIQTLNPWTGRISHASWFRVAFRPFVLYAYPSILWSTMVYSLSVGWLIVLSESVSTIYRDKETYNFSALGTGLVYISPFIGGVLGTAVAGKASDIIIKFMSRKNGGVYEPEFRLVMAIPVTLATCIGLMGFGWSAEEKDKWIVPTVFFGIISFGCSLGSTTAITFAVDSYRQFAGEALVTLNFSKNILHGLVFSLFFNHWLEGQGPKKVFLAIGGIQLACLFSTIPVYIWGKRARMWTVRQNFMEKF